MRTSLSRGEMPGVVASTMKLVLRPPLGGDHRRSRCDIQGADGTLWGASALDDGLWQQTFCGQYAVRIGGGTDEVQGNVIGERALGLPREPSARSRRPVADLVAS